MKTDIITVDKVSTYLKLKTAHHLAAKGDILGFKVSRSLRFRRNDIEKWINMQEKRAAS